MSHHNYQAWHHRVPLPPNGLDEWHLDIWNLHLDARPPHHYLLLKDEFVLSKYAFQKRKVSSLIGIVYHQLQ